MFLRHLRVLALTATAALALAGCATTKGGTTADGIPLVAKNKLTVCVNTPFAPFQVMDDGQIVGFDVDIMNLVADKLGVRTALLDTPFEGIKGGLNLKAGKCDIAAAGLTVTPQRRRTMNFSDPYFNDIQLLATRAGEREKLPTSTALAGKKVAAVAGTTGADAAQELAKEKGFQVIEYPDFGLLQQALITKQVDGAIADLPTWGQYNKANPGNIDMLEELDTGEKYAYAVRKNDDHRLLQAVNDTLREAHANGAYAAIHAKWLGTES